MRLVIIETGEPPAGLLNSHGSYPAMFERMLRGRSPRFEFFTIPVFRSAKLPGLDAFDGALITGSPAGVYESHVWIKPLEDFIRLTAAAGKPQTGICFGHQIMAQALGGRVEKSARGWGIGVHRYELLDHTEWMRPEMSEVACVVSHQDQVTAAPPGARILAASEFNPIGVLSYAQGPAVSFQMHPEFEHDFASDLVRARRERLPRELTDRALETLRGRSDRGVIADWIVNFYLSR